MPNHNPNIIFFAFAPLMFITIIYYAIILWALWNTGYMKDASDFRCWEKILSLLCIKPPCLLIWHSHFILSMK